ncbi:ricin B lectin domain-containing protein [Camillea tinctor]|nr:ricin B lectin domain-containing protein [Camillea tinctor]
MGFRGPGIYEILPLQAPTLSANSWGGGMEPGAVVKTYPRGDSSKDPDTNALWQLALVSGTGESAEYLIINIRTGYFITATADKTITSTPQISPKDPSCHWTIKSTPTDGYDVYTINNKIHSRGQLNVRYGSTSPGADILSWPIENGDNSKWYFDPR